MDELTIGDKTYISSKQAAKITGYAKDYVGQLCREGRVEARLVGRNWYVLESSIREHRFGREDRESLEESPEEAPMGRAATWQEPTYQAEEPRLVPDLAPKPADAAAPAIAEMQSAWREWFEEQRPGSRATFEASVRIEEEILDDSGNPEDTTISEPIPELETEAYEEVVPVAIERHAPVRHHDLGASAGAMDILPQRREAPVTIDSQRIERPVRATPMPLEEGSPWTGAIRALLIVLALAAAIVALIGTGHAERLLSGTSLDYGVQKGVIDYLGGTRMYQSSL